MQPTLPVAVSTRCTSASTTQPPNNERTHNVPRLLTSINIREEFSKIVPLFYLCFLKGFHDVLPKFGFEGLILLFVPPSL
jgi:hypothetical protein